MDGTFAMSALETHAGTTAGEADHGIREISDMFGISLRTIRFYEQKGLLSPARVGRFRVYGDKDIERLRFVQDFRKIGLSIREIKLLIKAVDKAGNADKRSETVRGYVEKRLEEITQELDFLKDQQVRARSMLKAA